MRETSIPSKLNCVYATMLGCAMKIRELEKNKILLKYYAVKGATLKGCRRTLTKWIDPNFVTRILHNIKVLLLYELNSNACSSGVLAVVVETNTKNLGLAGS